MSFFLNVIDNKVTGSGISDNIIPNDNLWIILLTTIGILTAIIVFAIVAVSLMIKIINKRNKGDE